MLSVLGRTEIEDVLVDLVFAESSTLGVRRRSVQRYVAAEWLTVPVEDRQVRVKVGRWGAGWSRWPPSTRTRPAAAAALDRPLQDVMRQAAEAARRRLG